MNLIGFASLCPICIVLRSNHQPIKFLWTTPPSHSFVFVIPVELPHPNPRQSTSSVLRYHSPKRFYNWFRDGQLSVNLCEREVFFFPLLLWNMWSRGSLGFQIQSEPRDGERSISEALELLDPLTFTLWIWFYDTWKSSSAYVTLSLVSVTCPETSAG